MIEEAMIETGVLSIALQTYAQGYIDARKRAGYAWLDMGRFLSEARTEAKYGEWSVFLEATNTSEDWAKRLIAIYAQSLHNRTFADAMRTNFLSVATGYELISAPPDVQDRLLNSETPPTQRQIRDEKHAAKSAAPPTFDPPPAAPDLDDILLRLDAHGYAKSGARQKGITTFYSFRDYRNQLDNGESGEVELVEGELPIWLAELDSHAAYAQAKQERYVEAQGRAARLGYDLRRDGAQFVLSITGQVQPALRGTLDAAIKAIDGYEKNAAKKAADLPPLPSADEQHQQTIEAILKEAVGKGERTGTHLYQQAYDHARDIHDLALHNKMIALIDRATDTPDAPESPSPRPSAAISATAYDIQVLRDAGRMERAQNFITAGEFAAARTVLDGIEVETYARDQLLRRIAYGSARRFWTEQTERLTRFSKDAMISQTTFKESLAHIAAWMELEATES